MLKFKSSIAHWFKEEIEIKKKSMLVNYDSLSQVKKNTIVLKPAS